ncbi:MAG TPA: hypothetical protein VF101_11955 [Gaiellaceae bacterium]
MRVSPTDPTLYLLDPTDLDDLPPHLERYGRHARAAVEWASTYLCGPHAALGREGPVCPYTQPSLERGLFWLTIYPGAHPELIDVSAAATRYGSWFLELRPRAGKDAHYKAILMLFPDLAAARAPDLIDTVQAALKPAFTARGLMIGQFHATCDEPGIWNRNFRPLRSPLPLLAIRHMVRTDAPFLTKDARYLAAYLRWFGHDVPDRLQAPVREAALAFGLAAPDRSNGSGARVAPYEIDRSRPLAPRTQ